jgi:3-deoxy-7-phosphoheptulonate synthase
MQKGVSQEQIEKVQKHLEAEGYSVHLSQGAKRTIMGVIGEPGHRPAGPGFPPARVRKCSHRARPFKRLPGFQTSEHVIQVGEQKIATVMSPSSPDPAH